MGGFIYTVDLTCKVQMFLECSPKGGKLGLVVNAVDCACEVQTIVECSFERGQL